jgi:hypothetical protein
VYRVHENINNKIKLTETNIFLKVNLKITGFQNIQGFLIFNLRTGKGGFCTAIVQLTEQSTRTNNAE